jgi:hypothetical protein
MVIAAGRAGAPAVFVLPPARQRDQTHLRAPGRPPDPLGRGIAVKAGNPECEQDKLGAEVRRHRQTRQPVVGGARLMPEQGQHGPEAVGRIPVVVDDQDTLPPRAGPLGSSPCGARPPSPASVSLPIGNDLLGRRGHEHAG